ncbi:hypothetical protein GCM10027280_47140 [Micromonospora polyrhachis]|uniref:DUF4233 domain-containing protein n=1 Tax=Micromonospora polyrhachis TaxID=1282883 RepID=A0A7W7SUK1_9ACTN|nr:hypothetical protein [Micromonospora polyrhachis]
MSDEVPRPQAVQDDPQSVSLDEPQSVPDDAPDGPSDGAGRRSGLKNPARTVRSLGAATLILEALVLLLAIQPIRLVGGDLSGTAIGVIVALAVLAVTLSGMMRRPWAWHVATVLQGLLMLSGFLHWSLGVLGFMFGLVWVYVLHVRRVILS